MPAYDVSNPLIIPSFVPTSPTQVPVVPGPVTAPVVAKA